MNDIDKINRDLAVLYILAIADNKDGYDVYKHSLRCLLYIIQDTEGLSWFSDFDEDIESVEFERHLCKMCENGLVRLNEVLNEDRLREFVLDFEDFEFDYYNEGWLEVTDRGDEYQEIYDNADSVLKGCIHVRTMRLAGCDFFLYGTPDSLDEYAHELWVKNNQLVPFVQGAKQARKNQRSRHIVSPC